MSCRSCRHYRRDTRTTLAAVAGDLHHLPGIQAAGEHQVVALCGLRNEYVDPLWGCEYESSRIVGAVKRWVATRRTGIDPDVAIRSEIAKKAAADADARGLERAKAERVIVRGACRTCHRTHPACEICRMPIMACGLCPTCRISLTVLRLEGGGIYWRCSNCTASGDTMPELPELPGGRCDGCRAVGR